MKERHFFFALPMQRYHAHGKCGGNSWVQGRPAGKSPGDEVELGYTFSTIFLNGICFRDTALLAVRTCK